MKKDMATKHDNFTLGCSCDHCGKPLHANHIWIFAEHFGCSKACVEAAHLSARPAVTPLPPEVSP